MIYVGVLILELIILFSLSQIVSKLLSGMLLTVTHNQKTTIYILSIIFLPGVVVHELAHWFVASILFVRTGEMEFLPQVHGDTVKLGSVAVAKTDPLRRFAIGVAPLIIGVLLLFLSFYLLSPFSLGVNWQTLLLIYISFQLGNTMFSSKKDMEGAVTLGIVVLLVSIPLYIAGIRPTYEQLQTLFPSSVIGFLIQMIKILLFPLGINLLIAIASIFQRR